MIVIQKTTSDERGLIADAVCPIMVEVEQAKDLLAEIVSLYFEVTDIKVNQTDAERIGLFVQVSLDKLHDACVAFGLLTGFESWNGTKYALRTMEQISCARRVDSLCDQLREKGKYMNEGKRKHMLEAMGKAQEMPDEQAETVLDALLKGV